MTEFTPPNEDQNKIRVSHVVIAVLAILALLQAAALFTLYNRRTDAKNPAEAAPLTGLINSPVPVPATHFQDPWNADPFEEFDAVSRRMSNLMRQAFMMGAPLMHSLGTNTRVDFMPAVDLEETKDAYIVHSDLPGLDKDKIGVTVKNNILTLEGLRQTSSETQDQKKGYYSQERSYGSFSRSLNLPGAVDETKVNATYKNGVLTITLPKIVSIKSLQKISVQ